ncbi:hypothetical protein Sango_0330600 [Sesamum angolense]|uniref:C2H2-type domain-containing protein n=1 Tax=Sesamum angolense TaxID=2727404 RepID=A0AAE2C3A4_9LAMI|nr:hypothetical protein Sango_0330600 [Sesamum angolense]
MGMKAGKKTELQITKKLRNKITSYSSWGSELCLQSSPSLVSSVQLVERFVRRMERLIIKLKIPRADELQFACPDCSRTFASGKALGGHKRVHMQKGKKSSNPRRELQIADGEAGNRVKSFKCPVCPQSFVSDKSLYGHMRAHPERNWRGMKPPTPGVENGGNSSLVPVSGSAVALLGNGSEGDKELGSDVPLLEWPQSARRSRHGKAPMNVPADPDNQELSVCGAYDLMALANGEPGRQDFEPKLAHLMLEVPGIHPGTRRL